MKAQIRVPIILSAVMLSVSVALAAQGLMTLPDRRLMPGSTATLTGTHFPAGARLAFAFEGMAGRMPAGSLIVGSDSAFTHSLRVPAGAPPDAYRLEARATGGQVLAGLDVAVLEPPAAEPRSDVPGPQVSGPEGQPASGGGRTMPGYDWPRLHAALNDLPAALLTVAVVFEIAGLIARRESFRAAGFWTLLVGMAGTIAAVVAGLLAEGVIEHDDVAHEVMERHKVLAFVTLGVFAVLAVWRVARRKAQNRTEQAAWSFAGLVGATLLVITAHIGGNLSFQHALGVPSRTLLDVLERRGQMPMIDHADSAGADSAAAEAGTQPHRDRPGTPPHRH